MGFESDCYPAAQLSWKFDERRTALMAHCGMCWIVLQAQPAVPAYSEDELRNLVVILASPEKTIGDRIGAGHDTGHRTFDW